MLIIHSQYPRPLNLLTFGAECQLACASSTFGGTGRVEVWNAATGALQFQAENDFHAMCSLEFVEDNSTILATSAVRAERYKFPATGTELVCDLTFLWLHGPFAVHGNCLYAGSSPGDTTRHFGLWKLPNFTQYYDVARWPDFSSFDAAPAVNANNTRVAVARIKSAQHPRHDIAIYDAATGKELRAIPLDATNTVKQLAFLPDDRTLLVRFDDRIVQMIDTDSGELAGELTHKGRSFVSGIAVHPSGVVACTRNNGVVSYWEPRTRELLREFDWDAGKFVSVAFNREGTLAAAGTEDGKIVVWDVDL
jgi:WD40 repeat protein